MESSLFSSLVRDPETLLAIASSVAPAQSRRGAGTLRSKGGRRSSEVDKLSDRGFLAGDGAPRGLEVQCPRLAADGPLSTLCLVKSPGYFEHVGAANQAVLPCIPVVSCLKS